MKEALRHNQGKPALHKMPLIALVAFARVLWRNSVEGGGAYPDGNWMLGAKHSIPLASNFRHLAARLLKGELIDPTDGLPHSWKLLVNAVFLVYYEWRYPELNDIAETQLSFELENMPLYKEALSRLEKKS